MIGRIRGILVDKHPPRLLVDCHGVGYEIDAPLSTFWALPELNHEVVLHTQLVVREDAQNLYGFATLAERALFQSLMKVSGIGARMALAVLSGMQVEEFVGCVQRGDATRLTSLPGIGKKTAERLIVEMRDRVADWGAATGMPMTSATAAPPASDAVADAVSGLIALGYKPQEASRLVHGLETEGKASEAIIREVLRGLARA
ncbi:MAG TPA: Holliday junction branch migration protein RuvA [Gammaproteobacteria bacterium]|nr:Holliday junction branch migration protein RuvA [Gammaproteobacteria bacterium]